MNSAELENRLIDFTTSVNTICTSLSKTYKGNTLSNQLFRAATSCSLNYGEARSASSKKDFIYKIRIVLKEMRECHNALRIAESTDLCDLKDQTTAAIKESNDLISIFVSTLKTAEKNSHKK